MENSVIHDKKMGACTGMQLVKMFAKLNPKYRIEIPDDRKSLIINSPSRVFMRFSSILNFRWEMGQFTLSSKDFSVMLIDGELSLHVSMF